MSEGELERESDGASDPRGYVGCCKYTYKGLLFLRWFRWYFVQ